MWVKDACVLSNKGYVEESIVKEGYLIASGVSVCYRPLMENALLGRSVFGDVFHIFKVNSQKPLVVRSHGLHGRMNIHPAGEEYGARFPNAIHSDSSVWNAALCMLIPGEETTLPSNENLNKFLFPNSFLRENGHYNPTTLALCLESRDACFDGNYSNHTYGFAPPSQVGTHLYQWITRRR